MHTRTVRDHLVASFALASLALSLGGCANSLYFGTETSGGLKVSGTNTVPTNVSFAYQRSEIAILPEGKSGATPSVFGGSDHDYSWWDGVSIQQTFATGGAAKVAVDPTQTATAGASQHGTVLFTTGTDVGLRLHFGDAASQTPSFLFGTRRSEAVIMPLKKNFDEANDVYADLSIVYDNNGALRGRAGQTPPRRDPIDADRMPGSNNGVRIKQQFATGQAALLLVKQKAVRTKLYEAAGVALPSAVPATNLELSRKVAAVSDLAAQARILAAARGVATKHGLPAITDYTALHQSWIGSIPTDAAGDPIRTDLLEAIGADLPSSP